jgi:tRNA (mo5U34)-methyltransferase
MERAKIEAFLKKRTYWYHKMELAPGLVTPGFDLEPIWNQIRGVRSKLNYGGKAVLDIASFDGMFAFEAERLGAARVIATDCLYKSFENFLFCREVFSSSIFPYFNVSPYNLSDRLDVYFKERYDDDTADRRFDIVQHLGLLYHLRDPMLSLLQVRSVLKPGGALLIETDFLMDREESVMVFNGLPHFARVRDNYSVWWAPSKTCLFEMLEASLFEVDKTSYSEVYFDVPGRPQGRVVGEGAQKDTANYRIGRAAVIAYALPFEKADPKLTAEIQRTYRNPGLQDPRMP